MPNFLNFGKDFAYVKIDKEQEVVPEKLKVLESHKEADLKTYFKLYQDVDIDTEVKHLLEKAKSLPEKYDEYMIVSEQLDEITDEN